MLDLCKSLNLYIVKRRKTGDLFGSYTCIKWNGNSVVDYLLTSASLFYRISSMKIGEFIPWLSDHCPVHFTLELCHKIQHENPETKRTPAPKSFMWSEKGKSDYLKMLKSTEFREKLEKCLGLDFSETNGVVNYVSDTLIEAAEKAKIKTKKYMEGKDPPWFDISCRKLKKEIKKLGR